MALSRRMLSGEKFFFQTLRASRGAGEVLLAPTVPGEIVLMDLDGVNEYMVQKDGFLAGAEGVKIESKMQSLTRGLLGGEGFFILRISGIGQLMLNSFGAIHKIELKPNEEYIVDNSHLVAWTSTTTRIGSGLRCGRTVSRPCCSGAVVSATGTLRLP